MRILTGTLVWVLIFIPNCWTQFTCYSLGSFPVFDIPSRTEVNCGFVDFECYIDAQSDPIGYQDVQMKFEGNFYYNSICYTCDTSLNCASCCTDGSQ